MAQGTQLVWVRADFLRPLDLNLPFWALCATPGPISKEWPLSSQGLLLRSMLGLIIPQNVRIIGLEAVSLPSRNANTRKRKLVSVLRPWMEENNAHEALDWLAG